jgi:hypothetical protein
VAAARSLRPWRGCNGAASSGLCGAYVREQFERIYAASRKEPPSAGALRQAWYMVTKKLPPGIAADTVDGVACLFTCPVDDEFEPLIDPTGKASSASAGVSE